jgi:hypothetical protein
VPAQQRPMACSKLATTAAEALQLVRKLNSYNIGRLLKQSPAELAASLSHLRLSEFMTLDGRRRTTELLMALLKRHTHNGTLPDTFAAELRSGCPSFFPYHQQHYINAFRDLEAIGKPGTSR